MKKIFFLLNIVLFCSSIVIAQTYREQFDKLNELSATEATTSNLKGNLGGRCNQLMGANIIMYKATNDVRYLAQFIILSKRVMDRRNDNWNNIYNEMSDLPLPSTIAGDCNTTKSPNQVGNYAAWTRFNESQVEYPFSITHLHHETYTSCSKYATFMDSGKITYPMAEFILLVQEHPELNSLPLPLEAMSNSGTTNSYAGASVLTFVDYANWLKQKVKETLNYELNQNYYPYSDYYFHLPDNPNDGYKAINQQCQIAPVCLLMYLVSVNDGTNITDYRDVAERTATKVYDGLNDPAIGALFVLPNGAPWSAWCHKPDCGSNLWEDISHAYLEVELMKLMVDNNTLLHTSNGHDFNNGDLQKIANGFLYAMCIEPSKITMNVVGNNLHCDQACTDFRPTPAPPERHFFQSGHYVFLSEYNPGVYQAISDMYSPNQEIASTPNLIFNDLDGNAGDVLFGIAQLCYYENLFNPITVKPSTGNQFMTGAAAGMFNGIEKEFALINNDNPSSSKISTFSVDPTTNVINTTSNYSFASGNCLFMAAGDVIPSLAGEEFITFDKTNNKLIVLSKLGAGINPVSQILFTPAQASTVSSVGIGEFDAAHSGKEIILNYNTGLGSPALFMYGYNAISSLFENIPLTTNGISMSPPFKFTVGDFNGDGKDEIAFCSNNLFESLLRIYAINSSLQFINTVNSTENNYTALSFFAYAYPYSVSFSNWDGIVAGDFDGDGTDEIMLERATDGKFLIYRQVASDIVYKDGETFPANQKNGIMCCTRLPNFPFSDVLVSFRNFDGQISIFNMDGLCPNLNLNNQTINTTHTLNNNYPLDYHVNGTLVAENNFNISSPSIVEMSSGKEIIFKPGFTAVAGSDLHAYIEPALECNPSTFRRTTPSRGGSTPTEHLHNVEKTKPVVKSNMMITPNPNNGIFQIAILNNKKVNTVSEIKIVDLFGKTIWQKNNTTENNFDVDISNFSAGIYYVHLIDQQGNTLVQKIAKQ
jgi:Secretion system C-terminal sorting domain